MRLLTFNDTALKNKTKVAFLVGVGSSCEAQMETTWVCKMLDEKGQVEKRKQGSMPLHQ